MAYNEEKDIGSVDSSLDREHKVPNDHHALGGTAAMQRVNSVTTDDTDLHDIDPDSGVKRALKTRHLSMMALAGIIGPGL